MQHALATPPSVAARIEPPSLHRETATQTAQPKQPILHVRTITLEPDAVLCSADEMPRNVWLLMRGLLRLPRINADGRRQILNILLPGDLIGEELHGRPGLSIEASTAATLCQLRLADFRDAMRRDAELRRTEFLARRIRLERMQCLTWMLGALTAEERLCAFLALGGSILSSQPQPDGSIIVSVGLSRLDMADLLCITVESISRILHRLNDRGAIEILGPSRFRIPEAQRRLTESFVGSSLSALAMPGPHVGSWAPRLGPPMTIINEAGLAAVASSTSLQGSAA